MGFPPRCSEVPMCNQGESTYVRTQEYSTRTDGPQLQVPSTPLYDSHVLNRDRISPTSHDFQEGDFVCPGFFQQVDMNLFVHKYHHQEWNYEKRRQPQAILPFLYLGPLACLRDMNYLRKEEFTLLLAIRNRRSAQARLVSGDKAAAELGIEADCIDVEDSQELISVFPRAIRRINDHLVMPDLSGVPRQKKVLVFCESGNERSATMVIAYIMVMLNLDVNEALHLVQQQRFCVSIDDPSRHLLTCFSSILEAKRDVERARRAVIASSNLAAPSITKKRSFLQHNDEAMRDEMMDMEEDNAHGRKPMAPFQDRWA